jgi:hypothetical protein
MKKRQKYLTKLFTKNGKNDTDNWMNYVLVNDDDVKWRQDKMLKLIPQNYSSLWTRGKTILKHQTNKSYELFNGRLAVVAPPVVKRVLQALDGAGLGDIELLLDQSKLSRALEEDVYSQLDDYSPSNQNAPVLDTSGSSSAPPSSAQNPNTPYMLKNVKPMVVPAHWHPWPNAYPISDIFFGLVKILIVVLKFFMMCIRPLSIKYRKSRWAMWFGSTLTSYQIALIMGMVPGNFGGFVEQIHSAAFTAFRQYFWMDPTHLWSQSYLKESRVMPLGKFEIANYFASPLMENLIELIFFALGTLIGFTGCGLKDRDNTNSHMRIGASISFMIPLTLSSVACIAKSFFIQNWDGFTIASLVLSIILVLYFLSEILNNLTGCNDSNMSEEDLYFRAFDVDEINRK